MRVRDFIKLCVKPEQNILITVDGEIAYDGLADVEKMEAKIEEFGYLWIVSVGTDEMEDGYLVIVAEF